MTLLQTFKWLLENNIKKHNMENIGYVLYNKFLKGYLTDDKYFTSDLVSAKINTDKVRCNTDIGIISKQYKEVESYNPENMEVRKVCITIVEETEK